MSPIIEEDKGKLRQQYTKVRASIKYVGRRLPGDFNVREMFQKNEGSLKVYRMKAIIMLFPFRTIFDLRTKLCFGKAFQEIKEHA